MEKFKAITSETCVWVKKDRTKRCSRTAIFSIKAAQKWLIEHTTTDFKKETRFWEKKIVDGDLDGRIQVNLRNETRDFSEYESCSSMKAPIQNLIQDFKPVVFEKEELEFRDMSELEALLLLLACQDSNSNLEI